MLRRLLVLIPSLLILGSAVGLFWDTYWRGERTPTEALRFFDRIAVLFCGGFTIGTVLGYPRWFRIGMSILMVVLCLQVLQLYVFRHFLRNASAESLRLATFMGLGRRRSIVEPVADVGKPQSNPVQSQRLNPPEGIEPER